MKEFNRVPQGGAVITVEVMEETEHSPVEIQFRGGCQETAEHGRR